MFTLGTIFVQIIDVSKMDRKQREDAINEVSRDICHSDFNSKFLTHGTIFNLQVHVLKAMRHPYIITYKESFMDKRCLCIVMDYADGGDLQSKIKERYKTRDRNGRMNYLTEDELLNWFT